MGETIREHIESTEKLYFSKFAQLSSNSKGRKIPEDKDELRTCYMVDRDRIIHSRSFRRLKGKTQVFILPENDHFMTRMTHTLEVAQVARTVAVCLNLNETLAEAIALCHDLGHTPFGHAGEEALDMMFKHKGGYSHESAVERRVEVLESRGLKRGLNLTLEVLDGALNHSGFSNDPKAFTLEGQIAPFADKFCYLTSDMENAISAGLMSVSDIPLAVRNILGDRKNIMLDVMIKDLISNSKDKDKISMSNEMFEAVNEFRQFMFKNVYFSETCRKEADKAIRMISSIYGYLKEHPEEIPSEYCDEDIEQNIVDYISSMTDIYCRNLYKRIFLI